MNHLERMEKRHKEMAHAKRKGELSFICEVRAKSLGLHTEFVVYISQHHYNLDREGNHNDIDITFCLDIEEIDRDIEIGDILTISTYNTTYLHLIELYLEDRFYKMLDDCHFIESVEPTGDEITGSIIVCWNYEKYVGYARNFEYVRWANDGETEADLITGNEDSTFRMNQSVLMTADECKGLEGQELLEAVNIELAASHWKWNHFKNRPSDQKIIDGLDILIEKEETED